MITVETEMQKLERLIRGGQKPGRPTPSFTDKERYGPTAHTDQWDFVHENIEVGDAR